MFWYQNGCHDQAHGLFTPDIRCTNVRLQPFMTVIFCSYLYTLSYKSLSIDVIDARIQSTVCSRYSNFTEIRLRHGRRGCNRLRRLIVVMIDSCRETFSRSELSHHVYTLRLETTRPLGIVRNCM